MENLFLLYIKKKRKGKERTKQKHEWFGQVCVVELIITARNI